MRLNLCTLALFLIASRSLTAGVMDALEVKTFSCQPGDTLSVQNNYGRVRVRPWDSDKIEVRIRKITADESGLRNITVLPEKSGNKISLLISYHDSSGESVYIEVRAPRYLNLWISGTDLAVEIYGIEGHVRASTVTGLVTAEDLTSSASLLTDSGDIQYRSRVQPVRDIRLESMGGDIRCRLIENLNLRSWIRAGGTLSWNQQIELNQGFLERQLGIGGPLLFASSTNGNVTIRLQEEKQPQPAHPPPIPPLPRQLPPLNQKWRRLGVNLQPPQILPKQACPLAKVPPGSPPVLPLPPITATEYRLMSTGSTLTFPCVNTRQSAAFPI